MSDAWNEYYVSDIYKVRDEREINDRRFPHFSLTIEDGISPKKERYERDFLVKNASEKKYKLVFPDDLVFNPPNLRFGSIARSKIDFKVIVSPSYEVFHANLEKFCPIFLEYLFCSDYMMKKYLRLVQGTLIERTALNIEDFLQLKVKIPNLKEQKKITKKITLFTKLIKKIKSEITRLNSIEIALLQIFFKKGLDDKNLISTTIGKMPRSWKIRKISQILKLSYGKSPKNIKKYDGKFPIYGTGKFIERTDNFLHDGDSVVLGRKGSIDEVTYATGKFWAIDTTFYSNNHKETLPKWVYYFFKNLNLKIYNESTSIPSLSRDTLYSISLGVPKITEQKKIVSILTLVENVIKKNELKLKKIAFMKKSFEQNLLTGKIKLS